MVIKSEREVTRCQHNPMPFTLNPSKVYMMKRLIVKMRFELTMVVKKKLPTITILINVVKCVSPFSLY